MEALYDDQIQLSQKEWKDLVENELDDGSPNGKLIWCMARVANCIRRRRAALALTGGAVGVLSAVDTEVNLMVMEFEPTLQTLQERYEKHRVNMDSLVSTPTAQQRLQHAHSLQAYGLSLSVALLIRLLLHSQDKSVTSNLQDVARYVADILRLSHEVAPYKPLGAMAMTICLYVAWIGASEIGEADHVEDLLTRYQVDVMPAGTPIQRMEMQKLKARMTLARPNVGELI